MPDDLSIKGGNTLAGIRAPDEEASLLLYYQEVDRHPLVTAEEERKLAARIQDGDEGAVEALVHANLRFVIHVARGFRHLGLTMGDLISEGNLGLVTAARRFDAGKNCRFVTYAVWWIRHCILQALDGQTRSVRVPANVLDDRSRLRAAEKDLAQDLGRDPAPDEIVQRAGLRRARAERAWQGADAISMETPLHSAEDGRLLGDVLYDPEESLPDEQFADASLTQDLYDALGHLSERDCEVLMLYYGMTDGAPSNHRQIGDRMEISRQRVQQLKVRAIRKLQHPAICRRLREWL